jgi:phosphatidylinositol-3-phosphatase
MNIIFRHLSQKGLLSKVAAVSACAFGLMLTTARAVTVQQVGTVWYILLENRNFTEGETSGGAQIYGSPAAPYMNSLITPGNPNAAQVSYCAAYHNVLATATGSNPSIHPSEPNYVWMENGSNLSKADDNDPYGSGLSVNQIHNFLVANPAYSAQNLSGLLQAAGVSWKAYSEGTNQLNTGGTNANLGGTPTATPAPSSAWTVPLASFSGTNAAYTNPYNGSHQWNFACKHTGSLFFAPTNGTTSLTVANTGTYPTNPEALNYPPLPNLAGDLAAGTCAQYNVITPDQYNDMHTALTGGFTYNGTHYTGDLAQIAQGDNFLSIVIPEIMASTQYQNGGAIVLWTDETEGSNQNDFTHTLLEVVISPLAKGNAYTSPLNYTHSSDVNTMQKIFQVAANTETGFLNDAANPSNATPANLVGTVSALPATAPLSGQSSTPPSGYGSGQAYDLSDLFQPGVIPTTIPVVTITPSGFVFNRRSNTYVQTATITNMLSAAITNPVYLEVSSLPSGATLTNSAGTATDGNPYVLVSASGLAQGASATVTLQFSATGSITDNLSVTTNGTP